MSVLVLVEHDGSHIKDATLATVTASVLKGAHIVRVHDVKEMVQVVRVADQIAEASR